LTPWRACYRREPKDAGAGSSESAGVQAGLAVSAQCAAHAAPPQKHELTRKMEAVWRLADTLRRRRTQPVHAAPSPREDRADAKDEDDGGYNELRYNKMHYIFKSVSFMMGEVHIYLIINGCTLMRV